MVESLAGAWAQLARLGAASPSARALFAADPGRFTRFSRRADGLLLDFSKTAISDEVLAALLALARAADVAGQRILRNQRLHHRQHRLVQGGVDDLAASGVVP